MKLTPEQVKELDDENAVRLTDEQLLEALRENGHTEAHNALEQKRTAEAAVEAAVAAEVGPGAARLRAAYANAEDPTAIRRRRKGLDDEPNGGD